MMNSPALIQRLIGGQILPKMNFTHLASRKAPLWLSCSRLMLPSTFHTSPKCNDGDPSSKALVVWSSLRQVRRSPVPALSLGLLGLAPFVGCPLYMVTSQTFVAGLASAQAAYGATILAFLGGVRWGFSLPEHSIARPDWLNLGYSVTPSLIAWGGLLLPTHAPSLFTLMGGLLFAGYMDIFMPGYPPWFKGLRFLLTFVAVLSLWSTVMCLLLLPDDQGKQSSEA